MDREVRGDPVDLDTNCSFLIQPCVTLLEGLTGFDLSPQDNWSGENKSNGCPVKGLWAGWCDVLRSFIVSDGISRPKPYLSLNLFF